jgi:DNA topoisomerase-3
MVYDLVVEVLQERNSVRLAAPEPETKKSSPKKVKTQAITPGDALAVCPKCAKGKIIKGKNAYGCSSWKEGCDFRLPFVFMDKKLSDNQVKRLIEKKATSKLKGFVQSGKKVEGILKLTDSFNVEFENTSTIPKQKETGMPPCPKCGKGILIKGKSAYGCSRWKEGCDFRFSFEAIREKAKGKPLTRELVMSILKS